MVRRELLFTKWWKFLLAVCLKSCRGYSNMCMKLLWPDEIKMQLLCLNANTMSGWKPMLLIIINTPLPTWWWQIHAIRCAFLHGNWRDELNFYKVFTQGDWIEMRVMLLRLWILHLFKTMNYFTDYFVLATWHSSKIPRRKSVLTKWQNVKKFKGYENFYTVPQF